MKESNPFSLLLLALILSLLSGCGAGGREAALGERFKLARDESVSIKETPMTVELKGVRRTWHVDGRGETADADLVVTLGGLEHRQWLKAGEEKAVGEYAVKV
ncbi:MAG TPA: hypothetical protein VD861_18860, partial [Pyrinomonadaceae bacterium]|nr:hypothetical protein [Pyrinomonadaceae bacterium]